MNKTAGNGAGERVLAQTARLLEHRKIPYEIRATKGPGDAKRLADEALREGADEIVCIGGDGTISETVNGLAGRPALILFVPCGTGNDFVRMLKLPKDPLEALKLQLDGEEKRIDVGRVNDRYFLNISGAGFDTEVLRQAERFKRFGKGLIPYLFGLFAALKSFVPLKIEMRANGRTVRRTVTIFSVGNGRYLGGGMKAVPNARINDGLFDVILADRVGKLGILKFLSKYISGKHTSLPIIHEFRCRELTVHCPGMTVDIDGELAAMDTVHYEVLPGVLICRFPVRAHTP